MENNETEVIQEEKPKTKDERILELQESIDALKSQLSNPSSTLHQVLVSNKKNTILTWAEWLEELHSLGAYQDDKGNSLEVDTISGYIKREIRKMKLPIQKELTIINYVHEILPDKYINQDLSHKKDGDGMEKPSENTSSLEEYQKYFLNALAHFTNYHRKFAEIGKIYEKHLKNPETLEDLIKLTEWKEIAQFSSCLIEVEENFSILEQMLEEGNVRQSITPLQIAMYELLGADESYRLWAAKFGISPRQFQRIRSRESNPRAEKEDWKKKDPVTIIRKVLGSLHCPGCGFNLLLNRRDDDLTSERTLDRFRFAGKTWKIPKPIQEKMKKKNLNPIEVARLIWGKKIKLYQEKENHG